MNTYDRHSGETRRRFHKRRCTMFKFTQNMPSKEDIEKGTKSLMSYGKIFYFYMAVAVVCVILSVITTFGIIPLYIAFVLYGIVLLILFIVHRRLMSNDEGKGTGEQH